MTIVIIFYQERALFFTAMYCVDRSLHLNFILIIVTGTGIEISVSHAASYYVTWLLPEY